MCEESFALRTVREAVLAQQRAIDAHPDDGPVYEDGFITITRINGKLVYTGKPFRIPIIFKK